MWSRPIKTLSASLLLESCEKETRNDGKSASPPAVLCREFNRKYTQSLSPVVFIFSSLLHLDSARGLEPGSCLLFFFSAADILQLLDKYSSRGSAGSVWGQQQTPRRNAEHLSPPPLALRCTASASPGRFAPLPLVATPRRDVGVFSPDLHSLPCKESKWCPAGVSLWPLQAGRGWKAPSLRHFHQGKEATSDGGAVNAEAAIRIYRTTTFLRQAPAKAKTFSFPLTGFSDGWLLRWDVHQVLVKTCDWTILNGCDRLIIRYKIRLYFLGNFTDVPMLDMCIHPFGTIEKKNSFVFWIVWKQLRKHTFHKK